MKEINIDELKTFYINEDHTIEECAVKFSVSKTTIKKFLNQFNLKKTTKRKKRSESEDAKRKRMEKIRSTLMEKYGVSNPMQIKSAKEKAQKTNLEIYGAKNPNQNKDVLAKRSKTNLERYGHECSLGNKEIQKKAREKCEELYGHIYPLASKTAKEELLLKRKKTNLEKYGSEEITTSKYFLDKMKEICQNKYGTDSPNESIFSKTIFASRENFSLFLNENFKTKPTVQDIMGTLLLSDSYVLKKIHTLKAEDLVILRPKKSNSENEIKNFLIEIGIDDSDILQSERTILDSKNEIDIFIKSKNIGIEFNGTYWHSDIYKEKNYHQEKSKQCESKNIRLIHIYEFEWSDPIKQNIIKSIIRNAVGKNENRIYARNCEIAEITDKKLIKQFLNKNHLQGFRGASKTYGLFLNNELIQIMSFGINSSYGWEIIREASILNTNIVGGSSKLLNYFIKNNSVSSIFSYCDFNKFTGKGYEKLGMNFIGYTVPDFKWIINGKVFNRNPSKHTEMKNKSEAKIFGAGSKKYLLTIKNNNLKDSDDRNIV